MNKPLAPLNIVTTSDDYAVVLTQVGERVLIRPVRPKPLDGESQEWVAVEDQWVNRESICLAGFCENDYLPGLILATAGGYAHRYGSRWANK